MLTGAACAAAILALMTSFDILTNLVNVGYLFGAMMVAASVLVRRYLPRGPEARPAQRAAVLVRFWLVVSFSIGEQAHIAGSCSACYVLQLLSLATANRRACAEIS